MKFLKKPSNETSVFILFFTLVLIFTLGRGFISAINVKLLALSDEIPAYEPCEGENVSPTRGIRSTTKRKTVRRKKLPDKPATTILPKTKRPVVAWCDTLSVSAARSPEFPPLRQYDGKKWSREKTVIKAVTDGTRIKLQFHLYDSNPDQAITNNSRRDPSLAWMDDSIEFFLMKDGNAEIYAQYVLSVIGRGTVFLNKCNKERLAGGSHTTTPSNFILPLMSGKRTSDGFLLEMTIPLSNVGVSSLEPGETLLMQVVRNYRGQRQKDSMALQLFPTHIYADNRRGANNHHRKAFMPAKIVDPDDLETQ